MHDATRQRIGLVAGLLSGLLVGCDPVAAEPIVSFGGSPGVSGGPGTGGAPGGAGGGGGGAGIGGSTELPTVLGLCDSCTDSQTCGDSNDWCLRINVGDGDPQTGMQFCARDCDENGGCPEGYGCNQTDRGTAQCAPHAGNCSHRAGIPPAPSLDVMRAQVLPQLNKVRTSAALGKLTEDPELDRLAAESAVALALTGTRFGKFDDECRKELPNCVAGWAGEQQFQMAELGLVWSAALSSAVEQSRSAVGTSGTAEVVSPAYTRVGIGASISGDEAFVSFTYGP